MQIQLDLVKGKSKNISVGIHAIESIVELLESTTNYFKCTEIQNSKREKEFFKGFLELCSDLLSKDDLSFVKKRAKEISTTSSSLIEDYFEDPTREYAAIQVNYLKKCQLSKKEQGAFYTPKDVIDNGKFLDSWNLS